MAPPPRTSSELVIDLAAVRANWRRLGEHAVGAQVAAMVKADAYGLGAIPVAQALADEGCTEFFVAEVSEGSNCAKRCRGRHLRACGRSPGHHRATDRSRSHPGVDQHRADRTLVLAVGRTTGPASVQPAPRHWHEPHRTRRRRGHCAPRRPLEAPARRRRARHESPCIGRRPGLDAERNQLAAYRRIRAGLPMGVASLANTPGMRSARRTTSIMSVPASASTAATRVPGSASVCSRSFAFTRRCFRSAPSAPATRSVMERPTRRQGASCRDHRGRLRRRFPSSPVRPRSGCVRRPHRTDRRAGIDGPHHGRHLRPPERHRRHPRIHR